MADSIAPRYHVILKDQSGNQVAIFDDFESLTIDRRLNEISNYNFIMVDVRDDDRFDLFELDGQVEVWRTVPGCDLDWYCEFRGLHRKLERSTDSNGVTKFTSSGVGYNELLARKTIAYKAGTIRADKNAPAETVMKEYVEENLGPTADDTVVGRLYQGGFPNFRVEEDSGAGETWTGSRAFENVLDVIKEIANFSGIDFAVEHDGDAHFVFNTYENQLGDNRTDEGIGANGLNSYGNPPVIFDFNLGNTREDAYLLDRMSEANVIVVLGEGELSTRTTLTVSREDAIDDSPWNIREISRGAGNYDPDYETYSLTTFGEEALEEMQKKETFDIIPMQQPSTLYGKHYFLGDRVVVKKGAIKLYKKIVAVTITIDGSSGTEDISVEFADIPPKS